MIVIREGASLNFFLHHCGHVGVLLFAVVLVILLGSNRKCVGLGWTCGGNCVLGDDMAIQDIFAGLGLVSLKVRPPASCPGKAAIWE